MPLELEHNGTYTCIAKNKYGSTFKTITLDSKFFLNVNLILFNSFAHIVQPTTDEISIDIEPTHIFPIDSEIHFNCKFQKSKTIWWSSKNPHRRETNPLIVHVGSNYINKNFICHAKDLNGKLYKKIVRIQRYSQKQLIAIIVNNEMERILREHKPKSMERFLQTFKFPFFVSLKKNHLKFILN
jgi:hypothetical protein